MSKKSWNNGTRELEKIAGAVIFNERYDPNDKAYNRTPKEQEKINREKDLFAKRSRDHYDNNEEELSTRGIKKPSDISWLARDGEGNEDIDNAISKQETGPIDPEDPTKVVGGIEDAEGESLADHFINFASKVSAAEEGRDVSIDELRLELNALDAKLEALGRG
jgi:hypothetical protein|tara:strand:- start:2113 stop:2604 length:492 start_codon:yes stop_codon:yes gene_type:complete